MYLLDTNIIVEFLRGRLPHAYRVFMRSDPRMFAVPAIVKAELCYGVERAKGPTKERKIVARFCPRSRLLPLTRAVSNIMAAYAPHLLQGARRSDRTIYSSLPRLLPTGLCSSLATRASFSACQALR